MSDYEELKKILSQLGIENKYDEVLNKTNKFGPTTKFEGDSLIWLDLSNFGIKKLPSGVFDNLTNLRELKLFKNEIEEIPDGLFDKLTKLTELHLKDNKIKQFKRSYIDKLPFLNRLFLLGNPLPDDIAKVYANRQLVEQLIEKLPN